MDKWYFWVGLIAAICIAVYMMPQLVKIIKTKDTNSVSVAMVLLAVVGDLCFILNGIGILADGKGISAGLPVLLANLFGFLISAVILFFKVRNMQWAKKYNIKEDQIPANYKQIKTANAKARAEKKAKKLAEKQKQQIEEAKKETTIKSDSETIIG